MMLADKQEKGDTTISIDNASCLLAPVNLTNRLKLVQCDVKTSGCVLIG